MERVLIVYILVVILCQVHFTVGTRTYNYFYYFKYTGILGCNENATSKPLSKLFPSLVLLISKCKKVPVIMLMRKKIDLMSAILTAHK